MATSEQVTLNQRERRKRSDRRQHQLRVAVERRHLTDRRLVGRDGIDGKELEEHEFQQAMAHLCRLVRYPTCRQVLQVVHGLGYRRA